MPKPCKLGTSWYFLSPSPHQSNHRSGGGQHTENEIQELGGFVATQLDVQQRKVYHCRTNPLVERLPSGASEATWLAIQVSSSQEPWWCCCRQEQTILFTTTLTTIVRPLSLTKSLSARISRTSFSPSSSRISKTSMRTHNVEKLFCCFVMALFCARLLVTFAQS